MTAQMHKQMAKFIWSICNLLRDLNKRNEYRTALISSVVTVKVDVRREIAA